MHKHNCEEGPDTWLRRGSGKTLLRKQHLGWELRIWGGGGAGVADPQGETETRILKKERKASWWAWDKEKMGLLWSHGEWQGLTLKAQWVFMLPIYLQSLKVFANLVPIIQVHPSLEATDRFTSGKPKTEHCWFWEAVSCRTNAWLSELSCIAMQLPK